MDTEISKLCQHWTVGKVWKQRSFVAKTLHGTNVSNVASLPLQKKYRLDIDDKRRRRRRAVISEETTRLRKRRRASAIQRLSNYYAHGRSTLTKFEMLQLARKILIQRACVPTECYGDVEEIDGDTPLVQDNTEYPEIPCLKTKLKSWQCSAVNWMAEREGRVWKGFRGGLLCDDMGLGKTLSMLCVIELDWMHKDMHDRTAAVDVPTTLVVVDKTVMHVWRSQACQHFRKDTHRESRMLNIAEGNSVQFADLSGYRIAFITYRMMISVYKKELKKLASRLPTAQPYELQGQHLLYGVVWRRVVADEGHCLCKNNIIMSNAIRSLRTTRRWILTGTPVRDKSVDFKGMVSALGVDPTLEAAVRQRLMMCRSKASMDKRETRLKKCYLIDVMLPTFRTTEEKQLYTLACTQAMWRTPVIKIQNLTVLRQLCVAPELLCTNRGRQIETQFTAVFLSVLSSYLALNQPSTKMAEALSIVERSLRIGGSQPEHVVIFFRESCTARIFFDLVTPCCARYKTKAMFIDGEVSQQERENRIRCFTEGHTRVAVLTIGTGGQGINLVRANTVILMEPHWNDGTEKQAWDRCYRLGQYKDVLVHRLCIKDTEEERIRQIAQSKTQRANMLMDRDLYHQGVEHMSYTDAKALYADIPNELIIKPKTMKLNR